MKRFFCDDTIGKLMRKLRLLGFDSCLWKGEADPERTLLTKSRSRWFSYRGESFLISSDDWKEQLSELERRYSISKEAVPFTRCVECNSLLHYIQIEAVKNMVPERVYLSNAHFKVCDGCGKIYWKGTHIERIKDEFGRILNGLDFESDD